MSRTFVVILLMILLVIWIGTGMENLIPGDYLWPHLTFANGDSLKVILFKANWCQVCQKMSKETWPRLKLKFSNTKFEEIDCDANKDLCMQYGIGSFPTVLVMKNDIPIPYRGSWRYEEMVVNLHNMGAK